MATVGKQDKHKIKSASELNMQLKNSISYKCTNKIQEHQSAVVRDHHSKIFFENIE